MLNLSKNTINRMNTRIWDKFNQLYDYKEVQDEAFLGVQILQNRAKSRGHYSESN